MSEVQNEPVVTSEARIQPQADPAVLWDFLKVFLLPVVINKILMLYFGLKFTEYPGEGYGYGLIATVFILIFTMSRFLWKYRNIQDP